MLLGGLIGIAVGCALGWLWLSHHYRIIDARLAWWDAHNPPELRGTGPDYWRNPYVNGHWVDVDLRRQT